MSFANSETAWLEWCVIVWFPTTPPVSTTIYVHEQGDIPIRLSLPQMMNLGFKLDMNSKRVLLTCPALGYTDEAVSFSTSRHLVVDLCRIKKDLRSTCVQSVFHTRPSHTLVTNTALPGDEEEVLGTRIRGKTSSEMGHELEPQGVQVA